MELDYETLRGLSEIARELSLHHWKSVPYKLNVAVLRGFCYQRVKNQSIYIWNIKTKYTNYTYVCFRAHVKIVSRIVSYRTRQCIEYWNPYHGTAQCRGMGRIENASAPGCKWVDLHFVMPYRNKRILNWLNIDWLIEWVSEWVNLGSYLLFTEFTETTTVLNIVMV